MNEQQKAEFEKNVALLPKAFQDAIHESHWEGKIIEVGEKQGLYYDQIDTVIAEVALVLAGLEQANNLDTNITQRVDLDNDKIDALLRALNHEVFEPIEESVRQKTEQKTPQFVPTQTPSAATQQAPVSTTTQVTTGVFKVAPEKYSIKSLDDKKPNVDIYREPIE